MTDAADTNVDRNFRGVTFAFQIQEMLLASLMEMEFLHRQEELEHLELARALTLSMAAEEERLLQLMAEAKLSDDEDGDRGEGYESTLRSDAKVRDLTWFCSQSQLTVATNTASNRLPALLLRHARMLPPTSLLPPPVTAAAAARLIPPVVLKASLQGRGRAAHPKPLWRPPPSPSWRLSEN